ncbi:DUF6585 family protein [Thermomonospora cellulosilytica]|uniref:Uncharacterized protein n=1 Tax=Thermomonospora cellulosilytica TaxID=1411118 RepID=A0A7W3R874_9ACTN|nr:DUF6585 family protein [Thermomonospora cellulosilytica]MBA9003269.1 hypothetical protein [Thermomonospora cellulosilytica]
MTTLAREHGLGAPIRTFDARDDFRRTVVWMALLGPVGVLSVWSAFYYLIVGPRWLGALGVLLAFGYLGAVWWILHGGALRGWGLVVYAFENGLVRVTRRGTHACRWDEMRGVTTAGVRRTPGRRPPWRYRVTDAEGGGFVLGDELPGVRDLGEVLVAEVGRRVLPVQLAAVEGGATVVFGPFAVDREGIVLNGERVPWRAVRSVAAGGGEVTVRRADAPQVMTVPLDRVPNAAVLVEICRRLRSRAERAGARGARA